MSFNHQIKWQVCIGLMAIVTGLATNAVVGASADAHEPKAFELLAQCKVDQDSEVRLTTDGTSVFESSEQFNVTSYILSVDTLGVGPANSANPSEKSISNIGTSNGSHYSLRRSYSSIGEIEVYKNGAYYGLCQKGYLNDNILATLAAKFKVQKPKYEFATCRTNNAGGQIDITAKEGPVPGSVELEGNYDKGDGQETMVMVATSLVESDEVNTQTLSLVGQGAYAYYGLGYHPRPLNTLSVHISRASSELLEGNITSDAFDREDFGQNCVFKNTTWLKKILKGTRSRNL